MANNSKIYQGYASEISQEKRKQDKATLIFGTLKFRKKITWDFVCREK